MIFFQITEINGNFMEVIIPYYAFSMLRHNMCILMCIVSKQLLYFVLVQIIAFLLGKENEQM